MAEPSHHLPDGEPRPVPVVSSGDVPPSPASSSGPKPIRRMLSETRVSKIVPQTDSGTEIAYCTDFVRNFLRSDYNFCAAKFSVASKSKTLALDEAFREAQQWMDKKLSWIEDKPRRYISMKFSDRQIVVTHPLAGRLIRLLNQHDRLVHRALGAYVAQTINDKEKDDAILGAARHIRAIHRLCIPDNDRFSPDGKLSDGA
ncbi:MULTISPECIES: hypothetical protein [unclassified Cupriavidus]|uniref:hypothetical protein n=1 Tax=unclassified Cupriavidus TaxID=2640874 RepID=UPI0010F5201D|nr:MULTISPECIES: hypothetical protein [unclassified Cupriavidus]MWL91989.1 hypothetical protein [Cupriavidus sp. SW-Y-13]